jgi:hypothetical protein
LQIPSIAYGMSRSLYSCRRETVGFNSVEALTFEHPLRVASYQIPDSRFRIVSYQFYFSQILELKLREVKCTLTFNRQRASRQRVTFTSSHCRPPLANCQLLFRWQHISDRADLPCSAVGNNKKSTPHLTEAPVRIFDLVPAINNAGRGVDEA